jgi:hypothetical protein
LFGGTLDGEVIYQRLLGRDSEDVLGAFKGLRWEGVVVDEAAVIKFSVRDVIGRVSGGAGAMRQSISVLSNLNTWRTSHCGLPPGDRVADRNGCKRATRVLVGAGQPLRRAQGLHLGLQGVRRRLSSFLHHGQKALFSSAWFQLSRALLFRPN